MMKEERTELLAANLEAMVGEPAFQAVVSKMKDGLSPKEQCVLDAINTMDQPRVGAVAKLAKLDKEAVKDTLPKLGYEMIAAGWIRKLPIK